MSKCPHSWRLESADEESAVWRCDWCYRTVATSANEAVRLRDEEEKQEWLVLNPNLPKDAVDD